MELITLTSSFQPDKLIENYEAAIFTERYSTYGDFVITGGDIAGLIALLPRNSYISCTESSVPMIVEDYQIVKEKGKGPQIQITGRSFETVLDRRVSIKDAPPAPRATWTMTADKESDAAYKAMRMVLGDFPRYQSGVSVLGVQTPVVAEDAIPEIDLTLPADYSTGTTNTYEIKPGDLYKTVIDLINANNHGLKSVRPTPGLGGTQAGIEIYNGADLTNDVVFNARFDQFDKATYLLTDQGSKNVAYVYDTASAVVLKTAAPEPTGLARRVLLVDDSTESVTAASRTARGLVELYKYNALALFDGEISDQVAAGYNSQYYLGDIIRFDGEYITSQNVRVVEFIRSSDSSGTKAYPTFQTVF